LTIGIFIVLGIYQKGAACATYSQSDSGAKQHKFFAENNFLDQTLEIKYLIFKENFFARRMSILLKPA
jgi:hypothetical protein